MTKTTDTVALVEAVRRGELAAFDGLVRAHQDAAFAYALVLTKSRAMAQDAVQDAFLDAYLRLPQLREAGAFRAWLRRIVFKHCDRQRRRRSEVPVVERHAESADEAFEAREQRARMFDVIEQLPEPERFVVALHYLGDQRVQAIADFLALTPSAVKKRLYSARQRLRSLEETMTPMPARPFARRIQLFLALRAGARDVVEQILAHRPDLLESSERWRDEEALTGGFTLAHAQTPLILAAGLGDIEMVDLLLARGAEPDGRCDCENGETALWAAARAGHHLVVERLLKAGANPKARNGKGFDAAALAIWRGDGDLAERLGEPKPDRRPTGWSLVDPGRDLLQLGIKALDLWMPVREGAVVRVHGAAETGLTVLLAEITAAVEAAGGTTVWTGWQRHPWQRRELAVLAARAGVDGGTEVLVGSNEARGEVLPSALRRLTELRKTRPVVAHVIFEHEGRASEVEAVASRLAEAATLTFVVRPWRLVTRGELDAPDDAGPFDATLVTDPRLAKQWLYPAIDPLRTRSTVSASPIAQRARSLIADYATLDPDLRRERAEEATASQTIDRARRLLAWLSQPFFTATPDTGWAGTRVDRARMEAEVSALLEGAHDETAIDDLRYRT